MALTLRERKDVRVAHRERTTEPSRHGIAGSRQASFERHHDASEWPQEIDTPSPESIADEAAVAVSTATLDDVADLLLNLFLGDAGPCNAKHDRQTQSALEIIRRAAQDDAVTEEIEERAAIMEYDGGLGREVADIVAARRHWRSK